MTFLSVLIFTISKGKSNNKIRPSEKVTVKVTKWTTHRLIHYEESRPKFKIVVAPADLHTSIHD